MKSIKTKLLGAMSKLMVVALAVSVVNIQPIKAANAATNGVSLAVTGDATKVGNIVTIDVKADNIAGVYGASVDFKYDTNVFEAVSVTKASGVTLEAVSGLATKSGEASVAATLKGNVSGVALNGTIATITAKVKAAQKPDTTIKVTNDYQKAVTNDVVVKLSDANSTAINYAGVGSTAVIKGIGEVTPPVTDVLTPGYYQEDTKGINYTGTWELEGNPGYSCSAARISNKPGDTFSFQFKGTGIKLWGLIGPSLGKAKITLTGNGITPIVRNIDSYINQVGFNKLLLDQTGLAQGTYNVTFEILGDKNAASSNFYQALDAVEVFGVPEITTSTVLKKGEHQENAAGINYIGTWDREVNANYAGGAGMITNVAGNKVTFKFEGSNINMNGLIGPTLGKARITLDDKVYYIDSYTTQVGFNQLLLGERNLPYGTHVVTFELLSDKNPNAKNAYQVLDSILIW